jgi:hypothetical protein
MRTLKTIEALHNFTHREGGTTTDAKIINLRIDPDTPGLNIITKKFKFSYRSYNAGEDFNGEIFDGTKFNHVFDITDLGITRDSGAYCVSSEADHKKRIEMLTTKGIEFIKSLY